MSESPITPDYSATSHRENAQSKWGIAALTCAAAASAIILACIFVNWMFDSIWAGRIPEWINLLVAGAAGVVSAVGIIFGIMGMSQHVRRRDAAYGAVLWSLVNLMLIFGMLGAKQP